MYVLVAFFAIVCYFPSDSVNRNICEPVRLFEGVQPEEVHWILSGITNNIWNQLDPESWER
jgi:hypothetical protein